MAPKNHSHEKWKDSLETQGVVQNFNNKIWISSPEHRHVDVLNRGTLWKVNEGVIAFFKIAEAYFLSSTKKLKNEIVSKDIVNALMEN